jgi:ankyrin repeat protein
MPGRLTAVILLIFSLPSLGCSKKPTASELAELNRELFQAVERHDVASARRWLRKGANIESTAYNDMTPLGVAASNDDLPMVQLLLQKGARAHTKDHSLETPLTHAAYGGHAEIVRLLLQQNPDLAEKNEALLEVAHGEPAIVMVQDVPGTSPADQTVSRRHAMSVAEKPWVETVKLLLDSGANIEARDEYRGPPLLDAAGYAQTDIVRYLLDRGANLNARDKGGSTALIIASCECAVATMNDAYDVVEVLLDRGSDVNAHSNDGTTALMNAAGGFGGSAIVRLLLEHGADPTARDSEGNTALKFASERDRKDKVELIRRALSNSGKR